MGNLIWHEYSRLVALTASVCEFFVFSLSPDRRLTWLTTLLPRSLLPFRMSADTFWAGFWGLIWRKFFWDFVGGTLRDPGGLQ